MVLEATVVCIDNSEWMRNGDYAPSRLVSEHGLDPASRHAFDAVASFVYRMGISRSGLLVCLTNESNERRPFIAPITCFCRTLNRTP